MKKEYHEPVAYEVKKRKITKNGSIILELFEYPMLGIIRESTNGSDVVQLLNNKILCTLPKDKVVLVYGGLN